MNPGAVVGQTHEAKYLDGTFEVLDYVRRPRAERIVASSQTFDRIICGRGGHIGFDIAKMHAALGEKCTYIHTIDEKNDKRRARDDLQMRLPNGNTRG